MRPCEASARLAMGVARETWVTTRGGVCAGACAEVGTFVGCGGRLLSLVFIQDENGPWNTHIC